MAEAGGESQVATRPAQQASGGIDRLLLAALAIGTVSLLIAVGLAALSASAAIEAVAVLLLAVLASQALTWWNLTYRTRGTARGLAYAWCYASGLMVFALGAGAAGACAVLVQGPSKIDLPTAVELVLLAALALGQVGVLYLVLASFAPETGGFGLLPPHLALRDPIRTVVMVGAGAAVAGLLCALLATGATRWIWPAFAETMGALLIALVLAAVAVYFFWEVRRLIGGVPVDEHMLRALTEAVAATARQTGAIRQVLDVEAAHAGPEAVTAIVRLDFKDGVSANHVAAVLATLRRAAVAAVPELIELALAPPHAKGSD